MNRLDARRSVLVDLGASPSAVDELLTYNENLFSRNGCIPAVPDDEPFVAAWRAYALEARDAGAFECLRRRLVQLRFPVRSGMSETEVYRHATRRGALPAGGFVDGGLCLEEPDGLRLELHPSAAGHVPLLITECRADFVTLVRALTRKNEPDTVPDSMGACMVAGYNNWDRIREHQAAWEQENPFSGPAAWAAEFRRLIGQKECYQDRFIVLSDGPYSAVAAEEIGLSEQDWRARSLVIRREHECAHYYTRRVLGSMRNNVLDEIIADYMGLLETSGRFRSDWFVRFMGLEEHPSYRDGGRLQNYVDGLSDESVVVLRELVVRAARNLERYGPRRDRTPATAAGKAVVLHALTGLTLEEMASEAIARLGQRQNHRGGLAWRHANGGEGSHSVRV